MCFLFALAWVVVAVGVGGGQPTGEDLVAWALAHWDAVGKGRAEVVAGFDPEFRMQGANYIIAAVTVDGLAIEDHFGTGPTSHRRDARNDVLRAAGIATGGQTVVEFVIPLDSGDAEDKPLLPGRTYTVLLAYHRTSGSFAAIHSARGSVQMELQG